MPLLPGTRLGPYEILAPLGAGGMGEVYRARDTRLGREVAVKTLPAELVGDTDRRARFEREARTVSALQHPHICVLYDVGREGAIDYLVMELIEGESLAERLTRGPLTLPEVLRTGAEVAAALARAHRAGIVHRDLKPANVMLGRSGAKLMDFGLARPGVSVASGSGAPAGTAVADSPTVTQPLTSPGAVLGTFPYLAPEQLEGHEADARSDVWALGCVLYEMATGRRAFSGGSAASVMSAILRDQPRPLAELAPLLPPALDRLVGACLAKDPEQRWQSAQDVALALAWAGHDAPAVRPASGPREERFVLSTQHVRRLSERNPRLVGYPLTYVDNHAESDTLVVYLQGIGADAGRIDQVVRDASHRAIAVELLGFGAASVYRPVLGIDDHGRLLRMLLQDLHARIRPRRTVLVGHTAGADLFLRMTLDPEGAGIEVDALIALSPNVSLDTCFASRHYAALDPRDPAKTLATLKTLASDIETLDAWLLVQNYVTQIFLRLGADIEPLRRYAAEMVAPFEVPGDPLADWYRAARATIPFVRLVFAAEERAAVDALVARHLDANVLGDAFTADALVVEPATHLGLLHPDVIGRHLASALASAG